MTRSTGLILLSLLVLCPPLLAQTPPEDLHLVGDHWTAWDPPSEFPEGLEVYTIVVGDTLWDLAQQFLGDPYLWPQIWERNQYILDAHWIYPGDPLLLGIEVADEADDPDLFTRVMEQEEEEEAEPQVASSPFPFVQLGHADDLSCSGFIGDLNESFPHYVSGSEYEILGPAFRLTNKNEGRLQAAFGTVDTIKYGLSTGDIVYLDQGRDAGLAPGDVFTAVARGSVVRHPRTDKRLGRYYRYRGRVRLLSVQESSAIAEISQACDFIHVGAELKIFEPEPVPSKRKTPMRPPSHPPTQASLADAATVVYAKDGLLNLARDHVLFIDQGSDHGLASGDILTVYRFVAGRDAPVLVLGEVALMSVRQATAMAKVVSSRYPIYFGDLVQ